MRRAVGPFYIFLPRVLRNGVPAGCSPSPWVPTTSPLSRRGPRVASVPAIWLVGALHASIHPKSIHALWRAERRGTKMGDVHAGHALQGLMGPTVSWGTLGAPRDCGASLAKDAPSLGFLPPPSPRRHPWITPANRGEQRVDTEQNKLQRARAARVLQGCNCSSESPTTKML